MSEARKCDRCHGYFELSEEDQKNRDLPYGAKGTYVKIMLFGRYGEVEDSVRFYDLCPNCIELLDKWLKNPEFMKDIHNFTDKDISEAAKFVETKSSSEAGYVFPTPLLKETLEEYGIKLSEPHEEPDYKDPCESCHNGKCEQCDYGYCSEEEKKKIWLENHKKEEK